MMTEQDVDEKTSEGSTEGGETAAPGETDLVRAEETAALAPPDPAEPALPTTRRGCPSRRTRDGAIMLVRRPPGLRRRRARFR